MFHIEYLNVSRITKVQIWFKNAKIMEFGDFYQLWAPLIAKVNRLWKFLHMYVDAVFGTCLSKATNI